MVKNISGKEDLKCELLHVFYLFFMTSPLLDIHKKKWNIALSTVVCVYQVKEKS